MHGGELSCPQGEGQCACVTPVGLQPIGRLSRDQPWSGNHSSHSQVGQLMIEAKAEAPGLIGGHHLALPDQSDKVLPDCVRRVGDHALVADLRAAIELRDDDLYFVDIHSEVEYLGHICASLRVVCGSARTVCKHGARVIRGCATPGGHFILSLYVIPL